MLFDSDRVMEIRGKFESANERRYARWCNEQKRTEGEFLRLVQKVSKEMHKPSVFADYIYIIEEERIPGFRDDYEENGIHKIIFVCVLLIEENTNPFVRTLDNMCREILQLGLDEVEKISKTSYSIMKGMMTRGLVSSSIANHQPHVCMRYSVTLSLPGLHDTGDCLVRFIRDSDGKHMVKSQKDRNKKYTCVAEIEQTIRKVFSNPRANFKASHLGPLCKFIFHIRNYRTEAIRFTDEELHFETPFLDHFPMLTYMVFYCNKKLPENLDHAVQEIFHETMDQFLSLCIKCLESNEGEFNLPVGFRIQDAPSDGAAHVTEVRSDSNMSVPEFCKHCYEQVMLAFEGPQRDLAIASIMDCNVDRRWTDRINYYSTITELVKVEENHVRVCAFISYWQMYNHCTSEVTLMEETARKHLFQVLEVFQGNDMFVKKTYLYTFCYLGFRLSFIGNGLESDALNFQVKLETTYSKTEHVSGRETENPLSILTTVCTFIHRCVNSPYEKFKSIGVNLKDLIFNVIFTVYPPNQFEVENTDNGDEVGKMKLETFQDFICLYIGKFFDLSTDLLSLLLDEDIPKIEKLFREQPLLLISDNGMAHGSSQVEIKQNISRSINEIADASKYFEIRLREAESFDTTSRLISFLAKQSSPSHSHFALIDPPKASDRIMEVRFRILLDGVKSLFTPVRKTTRCVLRYLLQVRKDIMDEKIRSSDDAW